MTFSKIRVKLAKQTLIYNLLLVLVTITYYILDAFDFGEFSGTIVLLTALAAIYMGALFKYIGASIQKCPKENEEQKNQVPFSKFIQLIVPIHYIVVFIIITLKAIPLINYGEMNLFLGFIEATFGSYMGYIISAIFKIEEEIKEAE